MKCITDPRFPPRKFPRGVILSPPSRSIWRKTAKPTDSERFERRWDAFRRRWFGKRYSGEDIRDANARNGVGSAKRRIRVRDF